MEPAVCLLTFLVAASLASRNFVWGQAPGDHDESCRTGMNAVNSMFPAEWRILMDTYDYRNLYDQIGLEPPVWIASDGDGDGRNWDTNFANPCTFLLSTCTGQPSQNNWLYSQYISYNGAREVFFDVTYRFTQCREPCNRRYVTLYHYVRDSVDNSERTNSVNYLALLGDVLSSRLEQPIGTSTSITETHAIPRPTNRLGFYLGVEDEGTCGTVDRINVYYVVCPPSVDGLVTYPETGVPVRSGPNIIFDAQCAPNAHNTTTLQVTAFASNSTCSPIAPGGARCECDAGYVISADGLSCGACPAGTYRALSGTSCQNCPSNTVTDVVAAPQCNCITGFFRTPQEGPDTGCTEPPTVVRNLQVMARTDTTITVSWSRPATTGRTDYFYRIRHSDPDNIGEFILERDNLVDGASTVAFTVTGLVPFNSYIIQVTTLNGVSEQDPDRANSRIDTVSSMTMEGIPGIPNAVQRLCSAVIWQEPLQPNGEIIEYHLRFSSNMNSILSVDASRNYLVTDEQQQANGVTVQVRARNGAESGAWTKLALVCAIPCMMDLEVTIETGSTITIGWRRPPLGGDVTYSIALSDRNGDQTFRTVEDGITDISESLAYTITQLTIFTTYKVKLTATSSLADVDPDVCTTVASTSEGVPSPPVRFMGLCEVLIWQPPAMPNGTVTSYDIEFNAGTPIPVDSEARFYLTTMEQRSPDMSARIRANTGGGEGLWTENVANDCSASIGQSETDESNAPFSNANGVELAIVAVCTFAVTMIVLIVVFVFICICMRKKNGHSGKSSRKSSSYSNPHEMKNW